ncbi:uncharacterized protein LOC105756190 [Trichechus manatus latirostris]|uniref:Uncharacterized protein LOC105756190 n=1 Tax=Trichechus manatus latirostris TaxID=127582 RepID=A0A2Y9FVW5_TRIMA|nr:uncharacterized protein LOC105756190 [Trichechus manatus latirostris]
MEASAGPEARDLLGYLRRGLLELGLGSREGSSGQKTKRAPSAQSKCRPQQKPRRLLSQDPEEEQVDRAQKGRLQLAMEPAAAAMARGVEQPTPGARKFKSPVATYPVQPHPSMRSQRCKGLSHLFLPGSSTDENLLPLTPRQLAAFQDIFKLLSSNPAGTMDMRSMKVALCNVGIQLSPQEMCEALRQADLDGDGTVSFKDFLGVLTDNHRFAQCLGRVRNSRIYDPQGLQTLFFEILLKLLGQGSVPSKSVQEVMSYYSKKQQALRNPSWRGQSRGHGRSPYAHAGLVFYCQAARVSGLSSTQLARSLHRLHKAGVRSPYSQIPNLALRTRPERWTRSRAPRPEVRPPKPYQPNRPKCVASQRQLSLSESGEDAGPAGSGGLVDEGRRKQGGDRCGNRGGAGGVAGRQGRQMQQDKENGGWTGGVHGPVTRVYAPLEAASLSANPSAEAAPLPLAGLFAETCREELVQGVLQAAFAGEVGDAAPCGKRGKCRPMVGQRRRGLPGPAELTTTFRVPPCRVHLREQRLQREVRGDLQGGPRRAPASTATACVCADVGLVPQIWQPRGDTYTLQESAQG